MNESFAIEGYWWLPDSPEKKIPGILSFTPGEGSRLKLMGALNEIQEKGFHPIDYLNPDIIHSITIKGESVTLYKCFQESSNNSIGDAGSQNTTEFFAYVAFFRVYFATQSDIQFTSLSVRFHNLESWYNKKWIQITRPESGSEMIAFDLPDSVNIQINDFNIHFELIGNESYKTNSVFLSTSAQINIFAEQPKPLDDFLNLIRLIQNFLTFAITEPTFVIEMIGKANQEIEVEINNFRPSEEIRIFYGAVGWRSDARDIFWAHMLMPFSEIENILPDLIKAWIEKAEKIKPVYDLYFAGIYRSTYPENEFLNLTQAIETYHRRIYGGQYIPENIYLNGLYKILVAAIPSDTPSDFRSSLQKGKLRYAYEYSLRKRISLLCEHILNNLSINFLSDKKARSVFAERIADTRNYLTHYSPELKEKAITGGKELFELNNQLGLIISICFLEELGIPFNKIESMVNKDRRYQKYF